MQGLRGGLATLRLFARQDGQWTFARNVGKAHGTVTRTFTIITRRE